MTDPAARQQTGPRKEARAPQGDMRRAQMDVALASGRARYLSATLTAFISFKGRWWIADQDVWFVVDDEELIANLDAAAVSLASADAAAAARAPQRPKRAAEP